MDGKKTDVDVDLMVRSSDESGSAIDGIDVFCVWVQMKWEVGNDADVLEMVIMISHKVIFLPDDMVILIDIGNMSVNGIPV